MTTLTVVYQKGLDRMTRASFIRDLLRQADEATRRGDHDKARSLHARAMAQAGRVTMRQS